MLLVLSCVLSFLGCATIKQNGVSDKSSSIPSHPIKIYQNHAQGIDSIISNEALISFNTDYKDASPNKAFAQSTSGAWSWKSNRTSIEHAKTSALIGCQRNNRKSEDLYPCKIIHANDQWVE